AMLFRILLKPNFSEHHYNDSRRGRKQCPREGQ
ncbi:MAG: hypothetical protein ACJAWH_001154, partial [Maribacter sp.]